eukprot:317056_1
MDNTFEPRLGILPDHLVETRNRFDHAMGTTRVVATELAKMTPPDVINQGCYEWLFHSLSGLYRAQCPQDSQFNKSYRIQNRISDRYYALCMIALERYKLYYGLMVDLDEEYCSFQSFVTQICLIPPYDQYKNIHCKKMIIYAFIFYFGMIDFHNAADDAFYDGRAHSTFSAQPAYIMAMHPRLLYRFFAKLSLKQLAELLREDGKQTTQYEQWE